MNAIPSKQGWSKSKTTLMRSFSVGRRDNIPKSSVQRTFPETSSREKTISENSIKTTASESPPEQALYFEAKPNAHRTYSDPNAPRNMSRFTVHAIPNIQETTLSSWDTGVETRIAWTVVNINIYDTGEKQESSSAYLTVLIVWIFFLLCMLFQTFKRLRCQVEIQVSRLI